MDFFIWNIKILIFFNFSGLTRVDPGWPMKPETRPLGRVNPRTGFNNYDIWNSIQGERMLCELPSDEIIANKGNMRSVIWGVD